MKPSPRTSTSLTLGLLFTGLLGGLVGCGGVSTTISGSTPTPSPTVSMDRQAGGVCAQGGYCDVGDIGPGGGTVFYVPGSEQDGGEYLEAALPGWSGGSGDPEAVWCNQKQVTLAGQKTEHHIGSGLANTQVIVAACLSDPRGAAKLADDYVGGGKTDWFLPSIDELNKLRQNKDAVGCVDHSYWSSSQQDGYGAISMDFRDGQWYNFVNFETGVHVRPVRAFY